MEKSINAIRVLSIDMIEKANSGHPGICMGAAPIMYALFKDHLIIDHENDKNIIRDRFVLSAGHGSAMLYSTLYLSGLGIEKEDLQQFRQLGSKTPGHPEITHTKFVDSTSGPLGQGIAQGVGMALAEKHNASIYGDVVSNYTYALCGDGDLQEGIASEASSLAGHFGLNKLIILWDSNDIQLDNPTSVATSEDIPLRYKAYGFNYIKIEDGRDADGISQAISEAKNSDKPTLIEVKTKIGCGSPQKEGKAEAHGAPLGSEETKDTKENYGWDLPPFEVSEDVFSDFQTAIKDRFKNKNEEYQANLLKLKDQSSQKYTDYLKITNNEEVTNINFDYEDLGFSTATRVASSSAINKIDKQIPNLIGGSADLSKSNNSNINTSGVYSKNNPENKNIPYGVREFAMAAITNGIVLYGMNKSFCATFFVFSDYLKPAIRMSAIQKIPTMYVLTHDSIAVGEDGPTHEPIEQITGLRAIPNVNVIRPCDFNETQVAYDVAIASKDTPTILVLSRQNLEVVATKEKAQDLKKGAYIIAEDEGFDKVIIATGSEVSLALKAKELLNKEGYKLKVVSMPSTNIFEKQSPEYKEEVLSLNDIPLENKYFLEMSTAYIGYKYAKNLINIESFGASGKGEEVIKEYNFTKDYVAKYIKEN